MPVEPSLTITDSDYSLLKDTDYAVEFNDNDAAGTATAIISGIGDYKGTININFEIVIPKIDINNCTIADIPVQTTTGSAIEPSLNITNGDYSLIKGLDYTVEFIDNITAGTATVIIKGIDNFMGTVVKYFEIIDNDGAANDDQADDQQGENNAGDDNQAGDQQADDNTGDDDQAGDQQADDNAGDDDQAGDQQADDNAGVDNQANDQQADDNAGDDNQAGDQQADDNTGDDNQAGDQQADDNAGVDNQAGDQQADDNAGDDDQAGDQQADDNAGVDNQASDQQADDNTGDDDQADDQQSDDDANENQVDDQQSDDNAGDDDQAGDQQADDDAGIIEDDDDDDEDNYVTSTNRSPSTSDNVNRQNKLPAQNTVLEQNIATTQNADTNKTTMPTQGAVPERVQLTEKQRQQVIKAVETFADVQREDWYVAPVGYMIENGIMNGTSDNSFSPQVSATRGMVVTILQRLSNEKSSATRRVFNDVESDQWYGEASQWAAQNGVVNGYRDGSFKPNEKVTREQFITMLYRYAKYKKYAIQALATSTKFDDFKLISSYAVEPMQWAINSGIIRGLSNAILAPQSEMTRAQMATMLMRFIELITKQYKKRSRKGAFFFTLLSAFDD